MKSDRSPPSREEINIYSGGSSGSTSIIVVLLALAGAYFLVAYVLVPLISGLQTDWNNFWHRVTNPFSWFP
ncbi:MAG: hypothetical protein JRN35_10580 [Nitrososphaerota archaeon]|nr:hypothetical protein [Nitrososphaerota archaeon]